MYSAGFLEGVLTAKRLSQFYSNFYQLIMKDEDNQRALANIKNMYAKEFESAYYQHLLPTKETNEMIN